MNKIMCIFALFLTACGTSSDFESPNHDFGAQVLKTRDHEVKTTERFRRPDLSKSLKSAQKRFHRDEELSGLLDDVAQKSLADTPWLEHPGLVAKRSEVTAALTEYDQARELEDLLSTYRSFKKPGSNETPVIAPHIESMRGKMADLRAEAAWHSLRGSLVAGAASIFEKQAHVTYIEAQVIATKSHLELIDELIPVVRARTGTGRSRQADFLTIRSERASVAAKLVAFQAKRSAAAFDLRQTANSATEVNIAVPKLEGELPVLAQLVAIALAHEPQLQSMKAMLRRRHQGLRLANLKASESARMPGGGVRAAIRREMEENIRVAEARIESQKVSLSNSVAQARANIVAARAQESALKNQSVPDARKSLEDLRASYGGRRASFLDVFRAARRRLDVELNLSRAIHDENRAEALLLRSLGRRKP
jgi:hypothetical protein